MRAFTLDSFEATPGLREDLPIPEVGEGDVLVRVHASSVNPAGVYGDRRIETNPPKSNLARGGVAD